MLPTSAQSDVTPELLAAPRPTAVCAICEVLDAAPLYKGLVKCRRCGFVFADMALSDADLQELYARNYFFGGEYKDYVEEELPLTRDFTDLMALLRPFAPSGNYLELGAAYGFSLNLASKTYQQAIGVEINPDACTYARQRFGLDVRQGDFLTTELPDNHFDVIACWATLEHLQTPHLYIAKIAQLLKPGGVFACTTVDIDGVVPRLRGPKWRQIHPPTHVSYYSRATLKRLMGKYGLEQIHSQYVGAHRSVDNMLYGIVALAHNKPGLYQRLKQLGLTRGTLYLNLFDLNFAVARKPK